MVSTSTPAIDTDTEGGWERRRRRIRDEIEATALELMAKSGFDEVTADQIAAASGISVRTFFRYFATKEDVVLVEPSRFLDSVCAAMRSRPRDESLLESVRAGIRTCDYWDVADPGLGLLIRDVIVRSPGIEQRIFGNSTLSDRFLVAVADRLGVPETDLTAAVSAAAIHGAFRVAVSRWGSIATVDAFKQLTCSALDRLAALD